MKEMSVGKWQFKVGAPRKIPCRVIKKLEEFINRVWLPVALKLGICGGWAKEHGYPTLVLRIDMPPLTHLLFESKKLPFFEFEHRPAGFGLLLILLKDVSIWRAAFKESGCMGIIHYHTSNQDDILAAEILQLPLLELQTLENLPAGPFLVRTDRRQGIEELEKWSLCPLMKKGCKLDLVELGLAELYTGEIHKLPWDSGFVIKPLVGKYCQGVEIYLPPYLRKELGDPQGVSTRSRIERILSQGQEYIIQEFFPPEREDENFIIWRVYFVYMCSLGRYVFAGGLWNSRPRTLRIHGASDATFGLLIPGKD